MRRLGRAAACCAAALTAVTAAAGSVAAQAGTTETETVTGDPSAAFSTLRAAPGWPRVIRQDLTRALRGRAARRSSLFYFAAIDEIHYTDEESPARVEFLDVDDTPFTAAWHPNEALAAFSIDQSFRAINRFRSSTVSGRRGSRGRMALAVVTGDSADNQQRNEIQDYVRLLEGGTLDPNSGVESSAPCPAGPVPAGEAARYTGVQDYNDYFETDAFYDPDQPAGRYAAWPRYPGLEDRAQRPFRAEGLAVPSYVSLGNHDRLQQGNQWANGGFQDVATGCVKPYTSLAVGDLTPGFLTALGSSPGRVSAVPRDPERRSVRYPELRALHATGRQADAHGFGYVDRSELEASRGAASYYAWSPRRGVRFISLNTVSEGGVTGPSSNGNIDDPQFRWLRRELEGARARDELVVLFGHHPIGSLTSSIPDEDAPQCGADLAADPNPGCDLDPRDSRPVHQGADLEQLLASEPNVVAYVAGHTGKLRVTPFRGRTGGFWQIESGSVYAWPAGARLLDLMDNGDGTLSLFTTVINQAEPLAIPASGTPAAGFSEATLASISRTLDFNDYQSDPVAALGAPGDRNVELVLRDPRRRTAGAGRCAAARGRVRGRQLGAVRLGRRRAAVGRAFPAKSRSRPRRYVDRFCLVGGGAIRVGYPSPRLRRSLARRERRRVTDRAVLALTSRPRYSISRVRVGSGLRTLRRRISRLRRFRVGRNTWYLARGRSSRLVFKVRGGRVLELGIADARLTARRRDTRTFLESFR